VLTDTAAEREGALPGLAALGLRRCAHELHRPGTVPGECQLATVDRRALGVRQLVPAGEGAADAEGVAG